MKRVFVCLVTAIITLLSVGIYCVADAKDYVPGILTNDPLDQAAPFPIIDKDLALTPQEPTTTGVNNPSDTGNLPSAEELNASVEQLLAESQAKNMSLVVLDEKNNILAEHKKDEQMQPASTMKTLTALAAVSVLDMESTLATRVFISGTAPNTVITIVSDGDMLMGSGLSQDGVENHAGMETLANQVTDALKEKGILKVSLRYVDILGGNERLSKSISEDYVTDGYIAPLASFAINAGRTSEGKYAPRTLQPAQNAADTFGQLLSNMGIGVDGVVKEDSGTTPSGATEIAKVESAPLADILQYMMRESDNTLAELFGRLVAVKQGKPDSVQGASDAVVDLLKKEGIDMSTAKIADSSGLGTGSSLSAYQLARVQSLAQTDKRLRYFTQTLPIAGYPEGTLKNRTFDGDEGIIRAKTGRLVNINTLAGITTTSSARVLSFAVLCEVEPAKTEQDERGEEVPVGDPEQTAVNAIDTFIGKLR